MASKIKELFQSSSNLPYKSNPECQIKAFVISKTFENHKLS